MSIEGNNEAGGKSFRRPWSAMVNCAAVVSLLVLLIIKDVQLKLKSDLLRKTMDLATHAVQQSEWFKAHPTNQTNQTLLRISAAMEVLSQQGASNVDVMLLIQMGENFMVEVTTNGVTLYHADFVRSRSL